MKRLLILSLSILILCGCGNKKEAGVDEINIDTTKVTCAKKDKILSEDKSALLVDVRTPDEYKESHLEKAINIEYQNVVSELKKKKEVNTDTKIIVYCKSGNRSGKALKALQDAGYKNVYDLGAMNNCK